MDKDDDFVIFVIVVLFCIMGGVVGFSIGKNIYQDQAITHNYAQYDTQTGEFKWKEVGE